MVQTRRMADAAHGYEFFGPPGATVITIGLPLVCYAFAFACNDVSGCPAPSLLHPSTLQLDKLKEEVGWRGLDSLFSTEAFGYTLLYYLWSFILNVILPASEVEGTELRSGGRLKYRFNAFTSALATVAILAAGTYLQGARFVVWTYIWENFIPLMTSNIIISYALSTFVYLWSFGVKAESKDQRELAAGGHSGNLIYDWFIGRELNPRLKLPFFGDIDIKSFMELRPGMLGWVILDLAFMARQYYHFGYVTSSIIIVCVSQAVYVFDALYMESAILTTIDITTDGFGFMLAFGDLAWLPFTYSIAARYLAVHPVELGLSGTLAILGVQATGYYIFRSANNEKNRFRTNPNDPRVSHLTYIQTKTGSKLITSGWWGMARHINYLGDWVMSWSYCLPTGIAGYIIQRTSPLTINWWDKNNTGKIIKDGYSLTAGTDVVPGEARGWGMVFTYFFMLYFAILLIHRERRDEEKCRRKYGKDWEEYCKKVPYRIIPYVY